MAKRYGSKVVNGERLKAIMMERGLFPGDFYKEAHISLRLLQKMMAGESCDIGYIKRVSDALGMGVEDLFAKPKAQFRAAPFEICFSARGIVTTADQVEMLGALIAQWTKQLEQMGIRFEISNQMFAAKGVGERWVVLLLLGKNQDDESIYSFIKVLCKNLGELQLAMESGKGFYPPDFGEIVHSGKGQPDDETKAMIQQMFACPDEEPDVS